VYAVEYPVSTDGLVPWQSRMSTPAKKIEICQTPFSVPSDGIHFSIVNKDTGVTVLSGNVPAIGFYEPAPGAFLGMAASDSGNYLVTYSGYFIPPESGSYSFYFAAIGKMRIKLGGSYLRIANAKEEGGWYDLTDMTQLAYTTTSSLSGNNTGQSLSTAVSFVIEYWKTGFDAGFVAMFKNNKGFSVPTPISAGVANDSSSLKSYVELPLISDISIDVAERKAAEMVFTVPLVSKASGERGYYFDGDRDAYVYSGDSNVYIKAKRLIRGYVGYGSTLTKQFTGRVIDFRVARSKGSPDTLVVTCHDFTEMLKESLTLSYPDWLDYAISGYLSDQSSDSIVAGTSKPPAWDYFPLQKIVYCMLFRGGIDSTLIQGRYWRQFSGSGVNDTTALIPDYGIVLDGNIYYSGTIVINQEDKRDEYNWPGDTGETVLDSLLKILDNFGLSLGFLGFYDGAPSIISPTMPSSTTSGRDLSNSIAPSLATFGAFGSGWVAPPQSLGSSGVLSSFDEDVNQRIVYEEGPAGANALNVVSSTDSILLGSTTGGLGAWMPVARGNKYTLSIYAKNMGSKPITARLRVATESHPDRESGDWLHPWNNIEIGRVTGDWRQYSVTVTAINTERILPFVKFDSSGDILVSQTAVSPGASPQVYMEEGSSGGWIVKAATGAIGGEFQETSTKGAYLDVVVTGGRIEIIVAKGPDGGSQDGVATCSYEIRRESDGTVVVPKTGINLFYVPYFSDDYPFGANLINNGSFEAGIGGWATSGGATFIASDDEKYDAGSSLRYTCAVGSSGEIYQDLPTVAGNDYMFSAWSLRSLIGDKGSVKVRVSSGGTTLTESYFPAGVDEWRSFSTSFRASGATTRLSFIVSGAMEGYIDKAKVECLSIPASSSGSIRCYYDGADQSGSNPCVVAINMARYGAALQNDTYRVRVTAETSAYKTRIDAIRAYAINYDAPEDEFITGPYSGSRGVMNSYEVVASSSDMRNDCIVVGGRMMTAVADESRGEVPSDMIDAYYFARTVDPESLYSKNARNYLGFPSQTIVVEPELKSTRRAEHISKMVVGRYGVISNKTDIVITGYPNMSMFSCIALVDTNKGTIPNNLYWVTGYRHTLRDGYFTTSASVTSLLPWSPYIPKQRPWGDTVESMLRDVAILNEADPTTPMAPGVTYDPYLSEARKYVRIQFDLLIDCHLRVEIVDKFSNATVAVLTDPTASQDNDGFAKYEAGWIELRWDGVNSFKLAGDRSYNENQNHETESVGHGYYVVEHCVNRAWYEDEAGRRFGQFYVVISIKDLATLKNYRYSSDDVAHQSYIYTKRGATTEYVVQFGTGIDSNNPYGTAAPPLVASDGVPVAIGVPSSDLYRDRKLYQVSIEANLMVTLAVVTSSTNDFYFDGPENNYKVAVGATMINGNNFSESDGANADSRSFLMTVPLLSGKSSKKYEGILRVENIFSFDSANWGMYIDKIVEKLGSETKYQFIRKAWSRSERISSGGTEKKEYYVSPAVRFVTICVDKSGRKRKFCHYAFWRPAHSAGLPLARMRASLKTVYHYNRPDHYNISTTTEAYQNFGDWASMCGDSHVMFYFYSKNGDRFSEDVETGYPNIKGLAGVHNMWFYKCGEVSW